MALQTRLLWSFRNVSHSRYLHTGKTANATKPHYNHKITCNLSIEVCKRSSLACFSSSFCTRMRNMRFSLPISLADLIRSPGKSRISVAEGIRAGLKTPQCHERDSKNVKTNTPRRLWMCLGELNWEISRSLWSLRFPVEIAHAKATLARTKRPLKRFR